MKLTLSQTYDVLVIGSGIAGLSAAVEAGKNNCHTAIVSSTHLFSGSSFYPGTWGFGLVGPENEDDIPDMEETIHRIGCGIADPHMVHTFVSQINPSICHLENMGCVIKKATQNKEREYIPCFDHKHRNWNGLEAPHLRKTFIEQLKQHNVIILENYTLIDIVTQDKSVVGAIFASQNGFHFFGCKSLILATGGYGSLFKYHLCTDDVSGFAHSLALKCGCQLINMEFMQMMPGYLSPARNTIFNEKTFRFAHFSTSNSESIFTEQEETLLDMRSTYGPFTSRLPSRQIDKKLTSASIHHPDGVQVSYANAAKNNPPEFIQVYFDWLASTKKVSVEDTIHIGIFSHAANGGIRIQDDGWTGIPSLYACGEVTGGMHGADRMGGLSTANGLVFGQRAGYTASTHALHLSKLITTTSYELDCYSIHNADEIRKQLQELMYQHAMVIRNEAGLHFALSELKKISNTFIRTPSDNIADIVNSKILEGQLLTATCILEAALLRKESRGSHYREDYPNQNPDMTHPIEITYDSELRLHFQVNYSDL